MSRDVKLAGLLTRQPCSTLEAAGRISEVAFGVGQSSHGVDVAEPSYVADHPNVSMNASIRREASFSLNAIG